MFTTVDPITGERDPKLEPLKTLKEYVNIKKIGFAFCD
jgi:uncharacterized protein YcbX